VEQLKDLSNQQLNVLLLDCWYYVFTKTEKMSRYSGKINELYHYTDLNGLIGIVTNQSLFASDIRFLNDSTEFDYGINLSKEIISSLSNAGNKAIIDNLLDKLDTHFPEDKYVTCFSSDGDLLQQWRSYAKDGKGVSVGFTFHERHYNLEPDIKSTRIIYNQTDQRDIIENCVLGTIEYFNTNFSDWRDEKHNQLVTLCMIRNMADYLSSFKHPCFAHEQECRFIYHSENEEYNEENPDEGDELKINFRTNGNLLIPYILLQNRYKYYKDREHLSDAGALPTMVEMHKRLPITKIIVGPSLDYEPAKKGIEILLKQHGYSGCAITKSALPYRI
jgi:hypothetical protein